MKFLEAHNGLCAKLIEKSDYDGIWVSSLTHSASKGLPDNELLLQDRIRLVEEISRVSTKPILVDMDTGGLIEHLPYYIKWFERAGAYGMVIEDKKYPKKNSLLEVKHALEDIDKFCEKIKIAKKNTKKMLIIARLESLIAKHSIYEGMIRAEAYDKAEADGILIHSKSKVSAKEVMDFARRFKEISDKPLAAIPITYQLPEDHPFDYVIYANHLMRASVQGMKDFLANKGKIAPVGDILC